VAFTYSRRSHLISLSIGLASIALVLVVPDIPALGGLVYFLMGPLHGWNGWRGAKAQGALRTPSTAADPLPVED
jgi:hypothetical protein